MTRVTGDLVTLLHWPRLVRCVTPPLRDSVTNIPRDLVTSLRLILAEEVTDSEALLAPGDLQPGLADLLSNILADDVRDLDTLLLRDGGALGGLHLGAHLLHPLPAGDLLDHLLPWLALSSLHEAAHLGLGLGADNLRDLDTLVLSVGGAALLMHSQAQILRVIM